MCPSIQMDYFAVDKLSRLQIKQQVDHFSVVPNLFVVSVVIIVCQSPFEFCIPRSDAMYALDAKAAIFRRAWRLLPALAVILIPASVLSKKSAMLSRSASERISLCFFALVSTRISV